MSGFSGLINDPELSAIILEIIVDQFDQSYHLAGNVLNRNINEEHEC